MDYDGIMLKNGLLGAGGRVWVGGGVHVYAWM